MTAASPEKSGAEQLGARGIPSWLPLVLVQVVAAGLVIDIYEIEGRAFLHLYVLAASGFVINLFLPPGWRMPFFTMLSVGAVFLVFGPADAAWLIACSLALIGICHLPVRLAIRVLLLIGAGALLAAARAGVVASPWSSPVWPILGSMFMFRLALYVMSMKSDAPKGRFWATLGYFFMFPNLVFPLYPVIDYKTFRRNYYDQAEAGIYQTGLMWIARGLLHLVLYRLVYHRFLNDATDVERLSELLQFMLATFFLYLKVSGSFHLIVGLLHLFGFRLPETHKLYYLSHNFTELWRRINIYWKDFMMSLVFYPVYFRVKKWKPAVSLGIATACVFAATWLLHSYQWFWLRGGFPVTAPDVLFWGILGVLVVIGALRELKAVPVSRQASGGWSFKLGLNAFATFMVFCFLWSLWSAETFGQWLWMLGAASVVDGNSLVLVGIVFFVVVLLGGRNWEQRTSGPRWWQFAQRPVVRTTMTLGLLFILAHPALQRIAPAGVPDPLAAMRATGLNVHDAQKRHRGYYEQLDVRGQLAAQQIEGPGGQRRGDWKIFATTGALRMRDDFLEHDLEPSISAVWNGTTFSTNSWGMRDQEYSLEKPPGTLRIALLGPSITMGNGVSDGESFEALIEERLNRELPLGGGRRFEFLNFSIDAYCMTQQVALLDERVLDFEPDVVIATGYTQNPPMTERYLTRIIENGAEVPYPEVRELLARAGLPGDNAGELPVPFETWRTLVRGLGLDPRMPHAEVESRVRRVSGDIAAWSVAHFAETTRRHGARPAMLWLNAVRVEEMESPPDALEVRNAGLPVFDLLNIFPVSGHEALRVAPWDDHPNAAGHRLIADVLYPQLATFLKKEFGET